MVKKKKSKEALNLNRIKVVLAEKNISQIDLSEKVKRDRNTISRICNNRNQPSLVLLHEMAIALDVDVRELITPTANVKESIAKSLRSN